MGKRFSEKEVQQVVQSTDIVDVVDEYLDLKRSGKNLKSLCPFHDENTPSFTINPREQFFYCFGCKEGGNVIKFVMEMEGYQFVEAVEWLAERSGIELSGSSSTSTTSSKNRKRPIYKVNKWAMSHFQHNLWKTEEGEHAREYVKERNLTRETTEEWKLGLAAPGWETLLQAGKENGIDTNLLETAGLVRESKSGNGYYDRLRGRLIFPIFDYRDRVVGFGGRILPYEQSDDDEAPKYLNSPETPVFNKRELLYGWNRCDRQSVREHGVWIAEGYTDVLMAHQEGLPHTVATLGTAIGEEHVKTLRNRVDRVVLLFDSDEAGRQASDRSLRLFLEEDTTVHVGILPEGEDPCSLLDDGSTDRLTELVEDAPDLIDYRLQSARERHDVSTVEGKQAAAKEVLESIRGINNNMRKQLIVKRIAEMINVDEQAVQNALNNMERGRNRSGSDAGDERGSDESGDGVFSSTAIERACRQLIGALVLYPDQAEEIQEEIAPEEVPVRRCRDLYEEFLTQSENSESSVRLGSFLSSVEDESKKDFLLRAAQEMEQLEEQRINQMVGDLITYIKEWDEQNQLDALKQKLRKAYEEGDQQRYKELLDQVSSLQRSSNKSTSKL